MGEHPDHTTVGDLWRDPAGQEWRQIGYSSLPTVMFEAEGASAARLTVAVDSPLARSFVQADDD